MVHAGTKRSNTVAKDGLDGRCAQFKQEGREHKRSESKKKKEKRKKRGISHVSGIKSPEVKINIGYVFETSGRWTFLLLCLPVPIVTWYLNGRC